MSDRVLSDDDVSLYATYLMERMAKDIDPEDIDELVYSWSSGEIDELTDADIDAVERAIHKAKVKVIV